MTVPIGMSRLAYRLYHLAWVGLDWLYPPECGGCGSLGARWCRACQQQTEQVPDQVCLRCGRPAPAGSECESCRTNPPHYTALRSWARYQGPVRRAIHRLKYEGDVSLGERLAEPLIELLAATGWQVDLVTPVPSGSSRLARRGYNQAALLALPLALGSALEYRPQALVKTRDVRSQVGLNAAQRRLNVQEVFQAQPAQVQGRSVLVVDDITTSGATLDACAAALLTAGASRVYGLTLAQAGQPAEGDFDPNFQNEEVWDDTGSRNLRT